MQTSPKYVVLKYSGKNFVVARSIDDTVDQYIPICTCTSKEQATEIMNAMVEYEVKYGDDSWKA